MNYLKTSDLRARSAVSALALSLAVLASPVFAQQAEGGVEANEDDAEIIVTGTLIRGVQPTGTTVIGIDRSAVESTGASTVTQLLQTVPQLFTFNTIQAPVGGGNTVTTNRPNLRSLPAGNLNGAASTLVLVDGHRVVGAGIQQTSPDLDTIAPGAIERVDIVPDGGSSIYGADAVGGVINFITRKTFDGVAVDGRFGFADDYQTWDVNATVGKTWEGGGIYVSYNHSRHDEIFGRDRDWVQQFPTQTAAVAVPVTGIECRSPNVQVSGNPNIYGLPFTPSVAAKLNQPNQCDYSDVATVYPWERRHSVFASLTQELSDSLTFDLKGFFMDRKQRLVTGYFHSNKTLGTNALLGQLNSPFRSQFIIANPAEAQRVSFAWGADDANRQEVHLQEWGITPTFTMKLGSNWQLRTLFNYGESITTVHSPTFNDTALNNAIRAGLFNPYNPSSSNSDALAVISNWETYGQAKQSQLQARAIIDGELFQLPGGGVKVAAGVEFLRETLRTQKGDTVPGAQNLGSAAQGSLLGAIARLPISKAGRNVKSAFGEVVMPVLADMRGFQELTLSASARYDSYSDAGDTFNPKFGLTWKPIDQLRLRAQWGKSFSAPSLANSASADPAVATYSSGAVFGFLVNAAGINVLTGLGYPAPNATNTTLLTLGGGSNSLKPQKAQTWSVGADLDPFPGARLSATYWNVKFNNIIGQPQFFNPGVYFAQYPASYLVIPSVSASAGLAAIQALLADATRVNGTPCAPLPQCVYVIERNGTQNLGKFRQDGLDFSASYQMETGFGSIDLVSAGTYILHRKQSVSATAALIDQLTTRVSRLKLRTSLGLDVGPLRAQATWNHTAGFDYAPADPALAGFYPLQSHVGAFNTIDLFFKYDFAGEGATKDFALTLSVNNLLDADPPVRYLAGSTPSGYGYENGSTIGRLIQVGISKKF